MSKKILLTVAAALGLLGAVALQAQPNGALASTRRETPGCFRIDAIGMVRLKYGQALGPSERLRQQTRSIDLNWNLPQSEVDSRFPRDRRRDYCDIRLRIPSERSNLGIPFRIT